MNTIDENFNDKRILIWGYGREGKATEAYIRANCHPASLEIYEGKLEGIDETKWDLVIKSPGIVMHEKRERFTSETELFLNAFADRTIGITGTKGKSTTSSLMYEALRACGCKAVLLGNIGLPCFDYINEIDDDTYIVFELSAHQLEHITKAPKRAIFLNLYPEHLDYYETVERYFRAKANIISHQTSDSIALVGENVPRIETVSNVCGVSTSSEKIRLSIPGNHNRLNAEFVRRMAVDILGLPEDRVLYGMEQFEGLPHRLKKIGTKDGLTFYDDSISTIPEATVNAAECIPNISVCLVGGMDRGIAYSLLEDYIASHGDIHFVLMYETGKRIADELGKERMKNVTVTEDLFSAVSAAKKIAAPGTSVVLSPAAASYGYFKNFEERGDVFSKYALGNDL